MTSEHGDSVEALLENMVERYFNIDCAIFTPNPSRFKQVKKMVRATTPRVEAFLEMIK